MNLGGFMNIFHHGVKMSINPPQLIYSILYSNKYSIINNKL